MSSCLYVNSVVKVDEHKSFFKLHEASRSWRFEVSGWIPKNVQENEFLEMHPLNKK